ncbi:MAG: hypothetical protein OXU74_17290 [Gemmatimonadota bacterium]|nr:hypothetical protein [Gemmatimonadota bacterium]
MAKIPALVGVVLAGTVGFAAASPDLPLGLAPAADNSPEPTAEPAHAPPPWGFVGHEMAAAVAVAALPDEMPDFFRHAGPQLVHLNPEPDRWRVWEQREMDQAFSYDHYVDLENLPDGALDAPDRFEYLAMLYDAELAKPERDGGFLPFRIVELYQRLVSGWRRWRVEEDSGRREWIEERIVNDAGVLGHYVTDASQPHHTTIHFNGWDLETPNPEGYTRDNQFHARFERFFVEAHVTQGDVAAHASAGPPRSVAGSAREAVLAHIQEAHAEVETLYRLDRDVGFDPEQPAHPAAKDFAAVRLAAGADMLAALWWSAWLESASPVERGGEDR